MIATFLGGVVLTNDDSKLKTGTWGIFVEQAAAGGGGGTGSGFMPLTYMYKIMGRRFREPIKYE